jgi:hypothetical protein
MLLKNCSYNLVFATAGLLSGVIGQQADADGVTGLLLVYPACLLVCLEVRAAELTAVTSNRWCIISSLAARLKLFPADINMDSHQHSATYASRTLCTHSCNSIPVYVCAHHAGASAHLARRSAGAMQHSRCSSLAAGHTGEGNCFTTQQLF